MEWESTGEEPPRHPDASAMLARLYQEGVTALYHFTSIDNLPSICERGFLYSKDLLSQIGILEFVDCGGNEFSLSLDKRNDNWDKVSLSFSPYTPMAYHAKRQKHLCYFCVSPEIATLQGVIFTDTNANRSNHRRGVGLSGLDLVDFRIIRSLARADKETWKRSIQAEVLIPRQVPLSFVQRIVFVSQASMGEAQRLCHHLAHPPFQVDKRLFADSPGAPQGHILFPYVEHLHFFAEAHPVSSMLYLDQEVKNIYSRSAHQLLRVVLTVRLIPGTEITLTLYRQDQPGQGPVWEQQQPPSFVLNFRRFYQMNYTISTKELQPGRYLLECYLDKVRRASYLFDLSA
jgi:hypothetical protein